MSSTIAAIATAPGGAIGIIRVSGPDAIQCTDRIFRGRQRLAEASPYTLHYGHIMDGDEVIDQVLISVFHAPHSYTGEHGTEISCHGSKYIMQRIMQLLLDAGCTLAAPGEFTQRAFLNGKMDLSQAEAVADLISSTSRATHRMAISQLRGGFSAQLGELRNQLLHLTSLLELELDFSEEDVEFADRAELSTLSAEIEQHITQLTDSFQTGNALKNGIPVVIIGAPNVGKSTLLNALVHEDRAIVSDIQGTTRDLIEECITLQGINFRFIDTAGIRKTNDIVERMGIERSMQAAERATIIILLSEKDSELPQVKVRPDQTVINVINKSDRFLPSGSFIYHRRYHPGQHINVSALTGDGIQNLETALVQSANIPTLAEGDVVVTNLRHYQALSHALDSIRRVRQSITASIPGDLIAQDLRQCLFHLAEITGGEITSDEVLGSIFRSFCIGK